MYVCPRVYIKTAAHTSLCVNPALSTGKDGFNWKEEHYPKKGTVKALKLNIHKSKFLKIYLEGCPDYTGLCYSES